MLTPSSFAEMASLTATTAGIVIGVCLPLLFRNADISAGASAGAAGAGAAAASAWSAAVAWRDSAAIWRMTAESALILSAKAPGTTPIMISMMSPIPFCPSFDPCAKLTPVQVRTSVPRIHHGGALPFSGAL